MKYEKQIQASMERLDQSLMRLRDLIKRGNQTAAIEYMENGELKDRFEELQNIITLSSTNPLGASGVSSVGNI